jgi:hypothetical protein
MGSRPDIDRDRLKEYLGRQGSPVGDLISRRLGKLYHYTDLAALASIVAKDDLWLTHSRFCNDAEEIAHGTAVVLRVIAQRSGSAPADVAEYLARIRADVEEPGWDAVYICCFCEEGNLLSQWRGYGANGTGIAIEVTAQHFDYITGDDCPIGLMRFWKVFYTDAHQTERVGSALDYWWARGDLPPEQRARFAADSIRFLIPTFKNADFSEEHEWRLMFTPGEACPAEPKFRAARGMLVPYYSLRDVVEKTHGQTRPLPIDAIVVGPGTHRELNVQGAKMLVQPRYPQVKVDASNTPYRA